MFNKLKYFSISHSKMEKYFRIRIGKSRTVNAKLALTRAGKTARLVAAVAAGKKASLPNFSTVWSLYGVLFVRFPLSARKCKTYF